MGNPTERVAESLAHKGEVKHVPEGGGEKFGQDPKVGTTGVAREVDSIKSGFLTFDPGGMSTIN